MSMGVLYVAGCAGANTVVVVAAGAWAGAGVVDRVVGAEVVLRALA